MATFKKTILLLALLPFLASAFYIPEDVYDDQLTSDNNNSSTFNGNSINDDDSSIDDGSSIDDDSSSDVGNNGTNLDWQESDNEISLNEDENNSCQTWLWHIYMILANLIDPFFKSDGKYLVC